MALNYCVFCGRLVADPETKTSQSGVVVGKFTIAVERDRANKDEERTTDFIPCTVFGKVAEFVSKWFKKGSPIIITGKFESYKYSDKDGNKLTSYAINVREVNFVPRTKSEDTNDTPNYTEIDNNDLPFTMS